MLCKNGRLLDSAVGVAYSGYIASFIRECGDLIDYVEVPFELLRHNPSVLDCCARTPIILHCASLSIGGVVICADQTVRAIGDWLKRTKSPWLGEHLAFITAARADAGDVSAADTATEPYDIGYTVSPPMNHKTLVRTVHNLERYQRRLGIQVLLENSPLYFQIPSSTMSQSEFVSALCRLSNADLLLDLAHLYISSQNIGFDPFEELERFPLDRVVEIHISGVDVQPDGLWDDHANAAPEILYQMLERVMQDATPRAITLEYNWASTFPRSLLTEQLVRVRESLDKARNAA